MAPVPKKILGVATGSLIDAWTKPFVGRSFSQDKAFEVIHTLEHRAAIKAIELTCGELSSLQPIKKREYVLASRAYEISMHFPFTVDWKDTPETRRVLVDTKNLVEMFDIKRIVVHPQQIPDLRVFRSLRGEYGLPVITELMELQKRDGTRNPLDKFAAFLDESGLKYCFDTGHAETHPIGEIEFFLGTYADRIAQLHLNRCEGKPRHPHRMFSEYGTSRSFELVKDLPVTGIIEIHEKHRPISKLEQEVAWLRAHYV